MTACVHWFIILHATSILGATGFTKVYFLDMKDSSQDCPTNFKLNINGNRRLCGKDISGSGCSSLVIPLNGQQYSKVRGRVVAYQYGSPDAFHSGSTSIDGVYVDGISIYHTQHEPQKACLDTGSFAISIQKFSLNLP